MAHPPPSAGIKRALLVGVGQYSPESGLASLHTPHADVRTLKALLDQSFCRFQDVKPLYDPDNNSLLRELNDLFVRAGRYDLVLFYFSGHGRLNERGQLHLCTTDTTQKLLFATSFRLSTLRELLDSFKNTQVIIVLDCCFSGAATSAFKGEIPELLLAELGRGAGKYLITSSTAAQVSLGRPEDDLSLFTKWVVEGLATRHADLNNDGTITLEELFRYAKDQVERESPGQHPQSFSFETSLGEVVIGQARHARESGPTSLLPSTDSDFYLAVEPLIEDGSIIPFLGAGIYGSGPLSSFGLATALAERGRLRTQESPDLAVAAEYLYRMFNDRERMLREFERILETQSRGISPRMTHDLILGIKAPLLLVSATYDMVLERRLEAECKPFVLVSHILHSATGEHDGKILVVRSGAAPSSEICLADQFLLDSKDERIIYKVLGSPFLRKYGPPDAELDTTVVTESDHMTFLGRLQHQLTKVPDALNLPLLKRSLLYLGYSLDLWHYRLVLEVVGRKPNKPTSFAVRQPTSQIEELCWRRLNADMIRIDPEQFARSLIATPTPL